jgi:arylsulfatase A-like enzyme
MDRTAVSGHAALAIVLGACSGATGGSRPNAVLVTLDTTRADALSCYGVQTDTSPNLDRLAAESTVFLHAVTTVPETVPAHCSMMTGLYPIRHTVRHNGNLALPSSASTLAERAQRAGYLTAAFIGAVVLDRPFGLAQGFDVYDVPTRPEVRTGLAYAERPGSEVVDAALAWLEGRERERPFLLWLHLFDAHAPYQPPPGLARGSAQKELYLGEVRELDRQLGRIFDALRSEGILDSSWVVVVGDHGEALGEHGEATHSHFCYQSTLRVPFMIRRPHGAGAARCDDRIASVVDVHPTLLRGLGLGELGDVDGIDLFAGTIPADRGVYFENYSRYFMYGWSWQAGWMDLRSKYVHSSVPELFDLADDPAEARNLVEERASEAAAMRERIAEIATRDALSRSHDDALDERSLEAIRGLGYAAIAIDAAGVPHPLDPCQRISGQAGLAELRATLRAGRLVPEKKWEKIVALLEPVVATNPYNSQALEYLAAAQVGLGRFADGKARILQILQLGPARSYNFYYLALCDLGLGDPEGAVTDFLRALELAPESTLVMDGLARTLDGLGRWDEAARWRSRLEELGGVRVADPAQPPTGVQIPGATGEE